MSSHRLRRPRSPPHPRRVVVAAAMPWPSPQGTQVVVTGSTRALVRAGHAVTLVVYGHGEGTADAPCPLVRLPRVPGYRRTRAGPDPVKPLLDLVLAARLVSLPADVILAHHVEAAAAALLARRRTGVPVVWVCHTLLEEELGSYLPVGGALAGRAGAGLDARLARHVDAVVVFSDRAAAWVRARGARRVVQLLPGVDPAELVATPRPFARPTVVYTGNADAYQDLPVLRAARPRFAALDLLLVGHGDFGAGWGPGTRAERVSDWAACRDRLAAAAVAVVPRGRCAGVPVKLLNALALGVPVVVGADAATGLPGEVVVAPGDPAALAAGVWEGWRRGRFDPAPVRARLDWEHVADRLGHIFLACGVSD